MEKFVYDPRERATVHLSTLMEIFVYDPRERATVHLSTRYSVADGASQHCGGPGGTSHGFVGIGMHAA